MSEGQDFDERVGAKVDVIAEKLRIQHPAERLLVGYFVQALMETEVTDPLQTYWSSWTDWYGLRRGWLARYYFGLGENNDYFVVKARGRKAMAGIWHFAVVEDGTLGVKHNGTACKEHKGLRGYNLMVAVLRSIMKR